MPNTHAAPTCFYHATVSPVSDGTTLDRGSMRCAAAIALLDAHRPLGMLPRSTSVWAASSIRDATALAAIHSHSRTAPVAHERIRVYRVELTPFHMGPLAVIDELQARLEAASAATIEPLVAEYWAPSGAWHVQELLTHSLTVLEEVPAASERDIYIHRWVHYHQDRERAQSL